MVRDCFRGFSDSLLASRQLYTEAPSHKLSAMLTEVWRQFGFKKYFEILLLQVGLPTREEHDALEDSVDCRRICRRMAGKFKPLHNLFKTFIQSQGNASSASLTLSWSPTGINRQMFINIYDSSQGNANKHLCFIPRYHSVDEQWDWTFPTGYPTF